MRVRSRFAFFPLAAVVISGAWFLSACGRQAAPAADASAAAERQFVVTGIVREPVTAGQIVIEHDAIPGFMPAMTMPFYVADESVADGLAPRDRVRFRFVVGERSRADRFEVIGRETSANAAAAPDPSPARVATIRRLKVGDIVPEFALVDHLGRTLTGSEIDGRLTVVTFIFTRCPVPEFCPAMTFRFAELQERILENETLRERARLLGVTLDPEFDRPEILRDYAEATGVDPDVWRLATGEPAEVRAFVKAFSVHAEARSGTLDHTLCTALIGPDRRVLEIWRGNAWKTSEVFAALETAGAVEAR